MQKGKKHDKIKLAVKKHVNVRVKTRVAGQRKINQAQVIDKKVKVWAGIMSMENNYYSANHFSFPDNMFKRDFTFKPCMASGSA